MIRSRPLVAAAVVALLALPSLAAAGEPVWGKDLVAGKEFPLPFGIGLTYYAQDQDYAIDELVVGLPGFGALPAQFIRVENEIDEVNARFDAWLLPYLNVFGILGTLDGETRVDFSGLPVPLASFGIPFDRITIDYDGEVYGVGVVLAGGTDRFFAALTAIATETSLSGDFDSSAKAFVVTPRFGIHGARGALFAGAMYQAAEESHRGTIALPLIPGAPPIPVPFAVELSQQDDWNWLVGGSYTLTPRWVLSAEGGFGDREHVDVAVTFRF